MTRKRVVLVAAVADNGVIGVRGALPWRLAEDMRHFRQVTTGNVVVMGRKTFESIGGPLAGRTNIVVTRRPDWSHEGIVRAGSLEQAFALAEAFDGEVMVIGGGEVYSGALAYADSQILTEVHQSPDGDAFYPAFDESEWTETRREKRDGYDFVWRERNRPSASGRKAG